MFYLLGQLLGEIGVLCKYVVIFSGGVSMDRIGNAVSP